MTEVVLPVMGEGVHEAKVNRWLKKTGDTVAKDDALVEVSTDKVDTEIVSPYDGVLIDIVAEAGKVVAVGGCLARLADEKPSKSPTTRIIASPLVRKMAQQHQIDLKQVQGSGLHGRLTKRDLEQAIKNDSSKPATNNDDHQPQTAPSGNTYQQGEQEYLDGVPVQREKMSRMRQMIAEHMSASVRIAPHVTTVFEVDVERICQAKQRYGKQFVDRYRLPLTYTPFFIHIAAICLKKFPIVNVSLDGMDILWKNDINIGCAVALNGGLIVPVVKRAGELSLLGITKRLHDLVTRARQADLVPDEVKGGTFTITNPGIYGSLTSNPLINQPQVAILGLGKIVPRVVAIDGMIAVRHQMLVSLTFDHRVIDGETGAKFLDSYRELAENYCYQDGEDSHE